MKANFIRREDATLLLPDENEDSEVTEETSQDVTTTNWQLAALYTTHTISMWNSRCYEFAAVLFTTFAYPHTLTVASLRGLTANLACLLFAPAVGRWCNQHPSRLQPLQLSKIIQRICICLGCLGWILIVQPDSIGHKGGEDSDPPTFDPIWLKHTIMAGLILLGMLEKLSWVGNLVIMERDWVPILANDTSKPRLHVLNANVKRIDLLSKLVAPLAVGGVIFWLKNYAFTALLIAGMQVVTAVPELVLMWRLWSSSPALHAPKDIKPVDRANSESNVLASKFATRVGLIRGYVGSSVFVPSISWVLQPLSVLTLSASMMVYLLSINFPLQDITVGRTLSTGVEITSTVLTPLFISWLRSRTKHRPDNQAQHLQPLITVGLLGLSWQLCMLVPAVASLLILPSLPTDPTKSFPVLTKVLLISLGLSRLGPFTYALVEQQLVQVAIPADRRVEFSGVEVALFSFAELGRWTLTGIFGKPEQFKGVAIASFAAMAVAAILFWWWTWNWKARLNVDNTQQDSVEHENPG